ncbi:transketolase [Hymenobacter negativus]|uniref:Transketolase n=1 Tax=Hymenobacter negativus TaxID=2795026 RepID=A0ABS0Q5C6_9BACT|nr:MULTISPECIES: transketolase [Bacteria]MBH8557854.1 transketolase [Hymenobacter negativus]MBH8567611.1 transketolase [Hymenobacter negativus]MBR7207343.1 transketolase [Microvirga sp. STS02]
MADTTTTKTVEQPEKSNEELKEIATQVRRDIVRMVHAVNSGHPGGSLGCTDLFVALFFKVMKHHPEPFDMDGKDQDIFFLSNGHISATWYSVLARSGYFPISELSTFRKLNSRLQGHPTTHEGLPGIRVASGSLGQGLSVACGAAQAKKMNGDKQRVFVLMGDGELEEGQNWEAALYASHHKIDNLVAIVDRNGQQIDGSTDEIGGLGDVAEKFKAFGWHVIEGDGNHFEALIPLLENCVAATGKAKPVMFVMDTKMGFGVDFMMDGHKWHGVAPNDAQLATALDELKVGTEGDY